MSKPFIPADLDDADLTAPEFRILCRIIRRESAKDGCYESIPNIAKGCQIGVAGVRKAIHSLVKKGVLSAETRGGQSTVFRSLPLSNLIGVTPINIDTPIKSTPTRSDTTPPIKSDRGTPINIDRQSVSQEGDPKKCIPKGDDGFFSLDSTPPKINGHGKESLPFDSPEFAEAWSDYEEHRNGMPKAKRLTPVARRAALRKLEQWGEGKAIIALRDSVASGWQGLFEPQVNGHNGNGKITSADILAGRKAPIGHWYQVDWDLARPEKGVEKGSDEHWAAQLPATRQRVYDNMVKTNQPTVR